MLFLFTGFALVLFTLAIAGLVWLVRSGQLDELDSPAMRAIADDPPAQSTKPAGEQPRAGG